MKFMGLASGIGFAAISLGAAGVWATDAVIPRITAARGDDGKIRTAAIHPAILSPRHDPVGRPLDHLAITRNTPPPAAFRQVLISDTGTVVARGYGTPGARIRLLYNDRPVAIATVGSDQTWKIIPHRTLQAGDHRLTIETETLGERIPEVGDEVRVSIPKGLATPLKIEFEAEQYLRRHAENIGDAASRFFDNFLSQKPATQDPVVRTAETKTSNAEESATAAAATAAFDWLDTSNAAYQNQIVPRLQVGGSLRLPQPGAEAPQRTVRLARLQMPTIDGITRVVQGWFGRSADNYDREIIPRLSGARPVQIVIPDQAKEKAEKEEDLEAKRLEEERRRAEAARREAEAERQRIEAENRRIEAERRRLAAEKKAEEDRLAALRQRREEEEAQKRREAEARAAAEQSRAEEERRRAEQERENAEETRRLALAAKRAAAERARLEAERARKAERDNAEVERQRKRAEQLRREVERSRAEAELEAERQRARRLEELRLAWSRARTAAERSFRRITRREPETAKPAPETTRVAARTIPPVRNPERIAARPTLPAPLPEKREAPPVKKAEAPGQRRIRTARATPVKTHRPRRRAVRSYSRRATRCRRWSKWRIKVPGRYVVRRGDSLWRIARRHYRHGHRYRPIFYANRRKIRNPNLIYPCQRFYIPRYSARRRR